MKQNFKNEPSISIMIPKPSLSGQMTIDVLGGFTRLEEIFLRLLIESNNNNYEFVYLQAEHICNFLEQKRKNKSENNNNNE